MKSLKNYINEAFEEITHINGSLLSNPRLQVDSGEQIYKRQWKDDDYNQLKLNMTNAKEFKMYDFANIRKRLPGEISYIVVSFGSRDNTPVDINIPKLDKHIKTIEFTGNITHITNLDISNLEKVWITINYYGADTPNPDAVKGEELINVWNLREWLLSTDLKKCKVVYRADSLKEINQIKKMLVKLEDTKPGISKQVDLIRMRG